MKTFLVIVLRVLWEFPQAVAGAVLLAVLKRGTNLKISIEHNCIFLEKQNGACSVCLGPFVFYSPYMITNELSLKAHEYGHSVQSMILGPAYLIVIGIPSLIALILHLFDRDLNRYLNRYPENWANRLGAAMGNDRKT